MNPPPFNDGLFSKTQGVISSSAWRQWLNKLVNGLTVLPSQPLVADLQLGALELYDDGTTGHLYITVNVAGVLTRKQIV